MVFLSNHIVMTRKSAEKLGRPASYSLDRLMGDTRFNGIVIKGRSYGPAIDDLIEKHVNQANLSWRVTNNKSLFKFIQTGRTDYYHCPCK